MEPYPYYGGPTSRTVKPGVRNIARTIILINVGIVVVAFAQAGALGPIVLALLAIAAGIYVIYRIVQYQKRKQHQFTMRHTPPPPPNHEISR